MQGIDPKYGFWFGVWTSILMMIAAAGANFFDGALPSWLIPIVVKWCAIFGAINSTILTAASGYSSRTAGPLVSAPTIPPIVKQIVLLAVMITGLLMLATATADAQALQRTIQDIARKNDANAPGGAAGAKQPLGQPADDAIKTLKEKSLNDLKYAAALAKANDNKTTYACWKAWVDLLEKQAAEVKDDNGVVLTPPEPDVFTTVEKLSELRQALQQGGAIQTGCAPLKDAAKKDIGDVVGLILGGGVGLAKLIPIIP
jgi:hypothetical protein